MSIQVEFPVLLGVFSDRFHVNAFAQGGIPAHALFSPLPLLGAAALRRVTLLGRVTWKK